MQVTGILKRCLTTNPDGIATISDQQSKTWRDTYWDIAKGGAVLRSLGAGAGDRVAVLALNGTTYFELLFAMPWIGSIIVPLNTRWSLEELFHAMTDSGSEILMADDTFLDQARDLAKRLPGLQLVYIGAEECPADMIDYRAGVAATDPVPAHESAEDDLWGILYTGGTTGHPKGVMLSNKNLFVAGLFWLATCHFTDTTRYLHVAGFFHIVATMPGIAVTMVGGTHIIESRFDPVPTMQTIEREKPNYATFVPTMLSMMLNDPEFGKYDLTSMGQCVYGGSPIPDVLIGRMIENLPTWEFIQGYGQTESTGILTSLPWRAHFGEGSANKRKATGIAVYGANIAILDPATGRPVPQGEQGEIAVRGPNVMQGYWGNPEATQDTIRDGWLYTGDAAYMDEDGYLTVVDRIKDMIVTGGENVFSKEVENAVSKCPGVQECAVIGIPDPKWGEKVHAVVVRRSGHETSEDEIISFTRELIAGYKCPRSIEFVDAMPMSAAGKVMKGELRKAFWSDREKRVN
ncbi:MAG: AMP-binding protein [Pseudomonadota bacterium]|nr:AMP-binding protein [Pseudomonadota bacterium]